MTDEPNQIVDTFATVRQRRRSTEEAEAQGTRPTKLIIPRTSRPKSHQRRAQRGEANA